MLDRWVRHACSTSEIHVGEGERVCLRKKDQLGESFSAPLTDPTGDMSFLLALKACTM